MSRILLDTLSPPVKKRHGGPVQTNLQSPPKDWMGSIIDCLFDPDEPATFQLLLREAMQAFIREGVDVVFCSASHSTLRRLLLLNGFLRIPGSLNFAYYDRTGIVSPEVDLDSWHLMRGDSDADANL